MGKDKDYQPGTGLTLAECFTELKPSTPESYPTGFATAVSYTCIVAGKTSYGVTLDGDVLIDYAGSPGAALESARHYREVERLTAEKIARMIAPDRTGEDHSFGKVCPAEESVRNFHDPNWALACMVLSGLYRVTPGEKPVDPSPTSE